MTFKSSATQQKNFDHFRLFVESKEIYCFEPVNYRSISPDGKMAAPACADPAIYDPLHGPLRTRWLSWPFYGAETICNFDIINTQLTRCVKDNASDEKGFPLTPALSRANARRHGIRHAGLADGICRFSDYQTSIYERHQSPLAFTDICS